MKTTARLSIATMMLVALGIQAVNAQDFIPTDQAVATLADGKQWKAQTPDGKTIKLTLRGDGTGEIRGPLPFALTVTWTVERDQFCLDGKMGKKCLRFRKTPNGLQGWEEGKPGPTFER